MASGKDEPVLVVGLGRFGTALALELTRQGAPVLAIDSQPRVVQSLSSQLARVVTADSTDIEALRQLGAADFQHAVVAIGADVEASILTTSLLSELDVENIWAKALSRQHGRILERVGAHHVVLPEYDMGERVAHLLSGRMLDYLEIDQDFAVVKTTPPRDLVGVQLRETRLPSKYGVTVVAVKRQAPLPGQVSGYTDVTAESVLAYDDLIIVIGALTNLERFTEYRSD